MKQFAYQITDPEGIHARPAGLLVKEAGRFRSKIMLELSGREADAKRIFAVMGLSAKLGAILTVTAEGDDEEEASAAMQAFFQKNL